MSQPSSWSCRISLSHPQYEATAHRVTNGQQEMRNAWGLGLAGDGSWCHWRQLDIKLHGPTIWCFFLCFFSEFWRWIFRRSARYTEEWFSNISSKILGWLQPVPSLSFKPDHWNVFAPWFSTDLCLPQNRLALQIHTVNLLQYTIYSRYWFICIYIYKR